MAKNNLLKYLESIDTHIASSIDSNESPTNPTSLDGKHPVDHFTLPDQFYPDFAFQPPNKKGRDDYSIGSWADSGFHESFAVETVIPSSNEDPTEEYDEDYWKERAIEIAMQDERYSRHSFNITSPPSIDKAYSASVDTHPHQAKRSYASIDTTPGTSIDIRAAAFEKEKGNIPIPRTQMAMQELWMGEFYKYPGRTYQIFFSWPMDQTTCFCSNSAFQTTSQLFQTNIQGPTQHKLVHTNRVNQKFRWEQKDEYGVYRNESRYARSVAGEMIPVTKDNIRKIPERASLFEKRHICLPERATSFTPTKLAPEIYTKDEINEMVTGYNELFRSMAEMRTEIESMQHILEKEATTSPSIDANNATSIDVRPQTKDNNIDRRQATDKF
ncbi:hypothetical protein DY000_02049117 [Brassica cretica]|uniref:Uncharacterized protein n=1 Tax=Brassica cretica TaxID=69181 RepID=A0ABQ7ENR5_BRACR|nr:hypothetical protein DY000_02049117 [Brassica cretica]